MARSLQLPMPSWLRKAIRTKAMTYPEAEAYWHLYLLATPEQPLSAPTWLHPSLSRLWLLEAAQGARM